MRTTILGFILVLVLGSTNAIGQFNIKNKLKNGSKSESAVPEKESPAKSDIQMAEVHVKSLNKMLEAGDFEHTLKRETSVKDKLEQLNETIAKIHSKDEKFDTEPFKKEYDKFKTVFDEECKKRDAELQAQKEKDQADKEAKSPVNVRKKEIESWTKGWVFSSSPISDKHYTPSSTEFNAGDMIYARVFFNQPIKQIFNGDKYYAAFEVDSKIIYTDKLSFSCEGGEDYLDIEIVRTAGARVYRLDAFNKLGDGSHKISILFSSNRDPNRMLAHAIGEIELNITPEGTSKWQQIIDDYEFERMSDNEPPSEGMKSSTICEQAIQYYQEKDFNGTPYKAYIDSDDWTIEKAWNGSIIYRHCDVVVWIKINNEVCEYSIIGIRQNYENGSYGSYEYNGIGTTKKVLCNKVK